MFGCLRGQLMTSEEETARLPLDQLVARLKDGDFSSISQILEIYEEGGANDSILNDIASEIVSRIQPGKWQEHESDLGLFICAALPFKNVMKTLGPVFSRRDLKDFSEKVVCTISANFLSNPDVLADDLLFVASRVVQHQNDYYSHVVRLLYSSLIANVETRDFVFAARQFERVIDFEPEATEEGLLTSMRDAFLRLASQIREGIDHIANLEFVNCLRFWSRFAIRNPSWSDAFQQICLQAVNSDRSLRINPFRLKVIEVMKEAGYLLPCIAPLAKILEKSMQEKCDSEKEFDWDVLMVADKQIARSKEYQTRLFSSAFEMLEGCLCSLSNDIAFPEIAAPVSRALTAMAQNEAFAEKAQVLERLNKRINQNSLWIAKQRRIAAEAEGFNIADIKNMKLGGKPPMSA